MDSSSSDKWLDRIDRLTEKVGRSASWLIVAVIAVAVLDVVMRYVFSAPTVWAYELNYMLGGTFALLGISYAQKHKRHMRMDLIYAKLSARKQLFIDIFRVNPGKAALCLICPFLCHFASGAD